MRVRRLVLALGGVGLFAACVGGTMWVVDRIPHVNPVQDLAMLPVIDASAGRQTSLQGFGYLSPRLSPRLFCDAAIIEIRPDGTLWRVGLVLNCGEFARRGGALVEGASGYPGIGEVAILSGRPGHYRMLSLLVGPAGYDTAWVDGNFSPGAASVILGNPPPTAPDPIGQARHAFGFPSGTPAVQQ